MEDIKATYKKYGYDMPERAIYKPRSRSRRMFTFNQGDEIELVGCCESASSNALGYALYKDRTGKIRLVNHIDLKEVGDTRQICLSFDAAAPLDHRSMSAKRLE